MCDDHVHHVKNNNPTHEKAYHKTYRLDIGLGEISVQFAQVEEREADADDVDEDPEKVEYVVAERPVHERAARLVVAGLGVGRQGAAQESRSQVYRDAGEPDHERAEDHALRTERAKAVSSLGMFKCSIVNVGVDFFYIYFLISRLIKAYM